MITSTWALLLKKKGWSKKLSNWEVKIIQRWSKKGHTENWDQRYFKKAGQADKNQNKHKSGSGQEELRKHDRNRTQGFGDEWS